jgi:uncharacterized OB-fold protein
MRQSVSHTWRRIPIRYRLEGNRCETCGTYYFPPRAICPKCRRKGKLVPVRFSGKGEIVSYSKVYVAPSGLEERTPYILALVKLEEGPTVLGEIVDVDTVKIGQRVEMVFRRLQSEDPEGLIHYGYKFRVVE